MGCTLERDSVQSSFDYADINIKEALTLGGSGPLKTCRGERFSRKTYQEDQWSLDESRDEKRLKMPDVKAKREQYQK